MKHPKSYDTTPETSKRMSRVHLKQGKAEVLLAKRLWHLGFRYRLNDKRLPGSPDIAILKYNIAIFVDGEFWHGQNWEERKPKLKRNREYWIAKIEENIARDVRNDKDLRARDWYSVHFWEKQVLKDTDGCVETIQELGRKPRHIKIHRTDGRSVRWKILALGIVENSIQLFIGDEIV